MKKYSLIGLLTAMLSINVAIAASEQPAPWGRAGETEPVYQGQKVVFDVTTGKVEELSLLFDRVNLLSRMNGDDPLATSIVVVVHNDAIPYFAIKNLAKYKTLMQRAHGATLNGVIEIRMCKAAARMRGLKPQDIHGFVTMVPMAEAEIARLQQQGYVYMR